MSVEQELLALKKEFESFKTATQSDLFTLQKNQSSRRGLDGSIGPKGDPGRDATVKIIQADGKIRVLSSEGSSAEIIAVPGPRGETGQSIVGPQGNPGKDSTVPGPKGDSPKVDEIVAKVVKQIGTRLAD